MCNTCYHRQGRVKKAWLCPHTSKTHYARGKCRNCYLNSYHKKERQNDESEEDEKSIKKARNDH